MVSLIYLGINLPFFSISVFFTDTDDSQDSREREGTIFLFHFTTSIRSRTLRQDCCSMIFITLLNYHFSDWLMMQCLFVYCHYFNLQFAITLKQFLVTFTSLIILISHISQLLRTRKFYCFRLSPHICFRYAWNNHLRCPMIGEVSLET